MKTISIVLCTFNEANYIEETVKLIYKTLNEVELIIVDDNSNDGTIEIINNLKSDYDFKFFVRKNERGLASAQKKGFEESSGDYVGTIDVNSRDQILYFPHLKSKLDDGYDVAVLSRYVKGGGDERVFLRSFASKAINIVSKLVLRIPFNDFTSGIFLSKRNLLIKSKNIITGYSEWFIEYVYIVRKKNFKLVEIPYVQKKDEALIESKSYPNIFTFLYLGFTYLMRIFLTILRN